MVVFKLLSQYGTVRYPHCTIRPNFSELLKSSEWTCWFDQKVKYRLCQALTDGSRLVKLDFDVFFELPVRTCSVYGVDTAEKLEIGDDGRRRRTDRLITGSQWVTKPLTAVMSQHWHGRRGGQSLHQWQYQESNPSDTNDGSTALTNRLLLRWFWMDLW